MRYGISRLARTLPALAALTLSCSIAPASAGLGGDEDSVRSDSALLKSQLVSTPMVSYTRHDIATGPDAMLHEYSTRAGKVFAVSWQGPVPPNLQQIFGSYYESYRAAATAQSRPGGLRQVNIAQPDLVVQSLGRMRAFKGKAYVPSLVPDGVDITELQ